MIPEGLVSRADLLFEELGGLNRARELFSDEEIIDLCLFNGYTYIIFPNYTASEIDLSNQIVDSYNTLDLVAVQYKQGTKFSILDKDLNEIYKEEPTVTISGGVTKPLFGLSSRDLELFSSSKEGDKYFILYEEAEYGNLELMQLIVSLKIPSTVRQASYENWQELQARANILPTGNHMISIDFSELEGNLEVSSIVGSLKDNYKAEDFYYNPSVVNSSNVKSPIYLTLKNSTWLSFRLYKDYVLQGSELDIKDSKDLSEAQTTLEGLGYTKIIFSETISSYINNYFTKLDGSEYIEITVVTDLNNQYIRYLGKSYTQLPLSNLEGIRVESVNLLTDKLIFIDLTSPQSISSLNVVGNSPSSNSSSYPNYINVRGKLR